MKYADKAVPKATSHAHARCTLGDRRPQPKSHRPMKVDSRKNAIRPSIASGAPKMSPT
jgi:hypothetical protein